jgi:hypothetical protein
VSAINSYLLRASAKDSPSRPPPGEADIWGKMMVGIRVSAKSRLPFNHRSLPNMISPILSELLDSENLVSQRQEVSASQTQLIVVDLILTATYSFPGMLTRMR